MVFQNTEVYIRREKETPRRDEQDFHMHSVFLYLESFSWFLFTTAVTVTCKIYNHVKKDYVTMSS